MQSCFRLQRRLKNLFLKTHWKNTSKISFLVGLGYKYTRIEIIITTFMQNSKDILHITVPSMCTWRTLRLKFMINSVLDLMSHSFFRNDRIVARFWPLAKTFYVLGKPKIWTKKAPPLQPELQNHPNDSCLAEGMPDRSKAWAEWSLSQTYQQHWKIYGKMAIKVEIW